MATQQSSKSSSSSSSSSKTVKEKASQEEGRVLDARQMAFLRKQPYHYNAWSQSILDVVFQPFWRHLATYLPKNSTASSITLVGLCTSVFAAVTTLYHTPTFTEDAPAWLFISNAVCLFLYQTLDALDGKQSYKTQCCELEEFTDHGADSLTTMFMAMMLASAFKMGTAFPDLLIPLFTGCLVALYTTHSVSYFTHSCVFEKFDVTEVQWVAIGLSIVTAVKGQDFWSRTLITIEVLDEKIRISLGLIMICASGFGFVNKTIANIRIVRGTPTPLEKVGLRIPRRKASQDAYHLLIILGSILAANYLIYLGQPISKREPALFMLVHGFAIAKASCILVVQSMTRGTMPALDLCLAAPTLLLVQSYFYSYADGNGFSTPKSLLSRNQMAVLAAIGLQDHIAYVVQVCLDICKARDINVFSMKYGKTHVLDEGNYIAGATPTGIPDAVAKWNKFKGDDKKKEAFNALYGDM